MDMRQSEAADNPLDHLAEHNADQPGIGEMNAPLFLFNHRLGFHIVHGGELENFELLHATRTLHLDYVTHFFA